MAITSLTPKSVDYDAETTTAYNQATVTGTDVYFRGACLMPPVVISGTTYSKGILLVLYRDGSQRFEVDAFDVSTKNRISILSTSITGTSLEFPFIFPLTQAQSGYCVVYKDVGVIYTKTVRANGSTDTSAQSFTADYPLTASPLAKTPSPAFHVGLYSSSSHQLKYFRETINQSTGTGTMTLEWSKQFTDASWADWAVSPNCVLSVQSFPIGAPHAGKLAAVLGTYGTTSLFYNDLTNPSDKTGTILVATNPKLAIINGGSTAEGTVFNSAAEISGGTVYGMCVNQFGEIFLTGSFTGDTRVLKYGPYDLATAEASLVVGTPTGFCQATLPSDSMCINPIWDGARLIVEDSATTRTRLWVFDRDLTYVDDYQVSTTAPTADAPFAFTGNESYGGRVQMNKMCTPWFGLNY